MPTDENTGLADRLVTTLLLRLVLDRGGELIQGEVVSLPGESLGRFRDWLQVSRLISTWTVRARSDS